MDADLRPSLDLGSAPSGHLLRLTRLFSPVGGVSAEEPKGDQPRQFQRRLLQSARHPALPGLRLPGCHLQGGSGRSGPGGAAALMVLLSSSSTPTRSEVERCSQRLRPGPGLDQAWTRPGPGKSLQVVSVLGHPSGTVPGGLMSSALLPFREEIRRSPGEPCPCC